VPLPIDIPGDWLLMNADVVRGVTVRAYDPAADAHADPGEDAYGTRGPARVTTDGVGDGQARVTRATWTLVGPTTRPPAGSLVVDGADEWVVDAVTPDPHGGTVFRCPCVLKVG